MIQISFFFRWNQHFWYKNLANSTRAILTHFWKLSYYQYSWVSLTKCFKFWVFRKRYSQCIVCRGFEPPSKDNPAPPIWPSSPFLIFPNASLPFWQDFYDNISPLKYQINTKTNSCGKVISLFLRTRKQRYMLFL